MQVDTNSKQVDAIVMVMPKSDDLVVAEPILHQFSYSFAKKNGVIVSFKGEEILVQHKSDVTLSTLMELRRRYHKAFKTEEIDEDLFDLQLAIQYENTNNNASEVMDEMGESFDLSAIVNNMPQPEDLLEYQNDAPIIRLINAILTEAIKSSASDIHIETFETKLVVRLRIDGVLQQILTSPRSISTLVISRIKVMAELDIAEKRVPQDGRISLKIAGRSVDVRVSTLPSGHGERIVMRILDKQTGKLDLDEIGMDPDVLAHFKRLINMPHGVLLVTGPTGSGKTTTLYSAISSLNDTTRNILTVEDPIEYHLDGIGQSQVNAKVNMTFARGLRAILRQDPDVVMVGEIRDLETADIAVQASLTGHLVLSTLHTNTAVGTVTRLRDMGVEPFLLASSVIGVLAQRLVRVLCSFCKQPHTPSESELKILGITKGEKLPFIYYHQGCDACKHTGFSGRRGIYELIEVNEEIRRMIYEEASEQDIDQVARKLTPSIFCNGKNLIFNGVTSIDEVMRVTQEI